MSNQQQAALEIYFYKDEDGNWESFSLTKEDGKRWNLFCLSLGVSPTFDDYMRFRSQIKSAPAPAPEAAKAPTIQ